MNKIKKIVSSIGVFIISIISKVYAIVPDKKVLTSEPVKKTEQTIVESTIKIGKITIPIVLFILILLVAFNKNTTKRVKFLMILALTLLGVLGWAIMNFIAGIQ